MIWTLQHVRFPYEMTVLLHRFKSVLDSSHVRVAYWTNQRQQGLQRSPPNKVQKKPKWIFSMDMTVLHHFFQGLGRDSKCFRFWSQYQQFVPGLTPFHSFLRECVYNAVGSDKKFRRYQTLHWHWHCTGTGTGKAACNGVSVQLEVEHVQDFQLWLVIK